MALIYNAGTWGTEAEESENSKYTEGSECMGKGYNGCVSSPPASTACSTSREQNYTSKSELGTTG